MSRPVEALMPGEGSRPTGLRSGAMSEDRDTRTPNERLRDAIRERALNSAPLVVNLIPSEPAYPVTYRPEGAPPGQYSGYLGKGGSVARPTEGTTNAAMNRAIRDASRDITGR